MTRSSRRIAWVVILVVELGCLAWGPFEPTEYLGLALVWGALYVAAPFRRVARPVPATG